MPVRHLQLLQGCGFRKGLINMKQKSKLIWSLVTLGLAILTILVVFSQSKGLTLGDLADTLLNAHKGWLLLAVLSMLGIIFSEAEALLCLLRHTGYIRRHRRGLLYASADIYFSAITPSASGGQPMTAFFMITDGVPGGVVTVILLVNLILYTISILLIGVISLLIRPSLFPQFSIYSKLLILLGYLILIGFVFMFFMLLVNGARLYSWGCVIIKWLYGKKVIKQPEYWRSKLEKVIDDYQKCVGITRGKPLMLVEALLLNLMHRISQLSVSMLVYLATGGTAAMALRVWLTQIYVIIGSNCVPIPGAMGAYDYLMVDGFSSFMSQQDAIRLELLSRSLSFYTCTLISAIITLIGFIQYKDRKDGSGTSGIRKILRKVFKKRHITVSKRR